MKDKRIEPLIEGIINPNWSYDELKNHVRLSTFETTSFGLGYPRVALDKDGFTYWIDFEYDLSKIRTIEKSDNFGRRYYVYERHLFNRIFLRGL